MKPGILRSCGWLGVAAVVIVVLADVLSWFLANGYSPVSQSISALAVGDASWLIDLGLWVFALGCVATGAGMLAMGFSAGGWRLAAVAAIAIGIETAVVAMVNQYAGTENAGGNVHAWAIYLLYASFAAAALGGAQTLSELSFLTGTFSRTAGWIWIVLAPVYYFWFPSGWAGAFERSLALLMLAWLFLVAAQLREKRDKLSKAT